MFFDFLQITSRAMLRDMKVSGIAHGIAYMNGQNIIHSDLKGAGLHRTCLPCYRLSLLQENILMSKDGRPMITDFGLSRMMTYTKTFLKSTANRSSGILGSVPWMAYELLSTTEPVTDSNSINKAGRDSISSHFNNNEEVTTNNPAKHTKATDMWAFGMVIYVSTFSV